MRTGSSLRIVLAAALALSACGGQVQHPSAAAGVPPAQVPDQPAGPVAPPPPSPPTPEQFPDLSEPVEIGWPAVQVNLPRYELRFEDADYRKLEQNRTTEDYGVPAVFVAAGRSYDVEVQFRGRSTRHYAKKSFQIHFPPGVHFRGVKQLELLASWRDAGQLTEKLWYDLAAAVGAPASRAEYVLLSVRHGGGDYAATGIRDPAFRDAVYLQVEAVKKDFLAPHGFDEDSDIYRCGMHDCEMGDGPPRSYQEPWAKRTNEAQPWTNLETFLRGVNRTAPGDFRAWVEKHVDLDAYFRWLAVQEISAQYLHQDSRSLLVQDRRSGKWHYVPWDLNNTVSVLDRTHVNGTNQGTSRSSRPLLGFSAFDSLAWDAYLERQSFAPDMAPAWNTLTTRLLADPALAERYADTLEKVLEQDFRPEQVCQRLEKTAALLAPFQLKEADAQGWLYNVFNNPRTPEGYYSFIDPRFVSPTSRSGGKPFSAWWLCKFITERHAFLLAEVQRFRSEHNRSDLVINGVGRDANGAAWVDLANRGAAAVDLGGHYLSGALRNPQQWQLPALSLEPGATVRLSSTDPVEAQRLGIALDFERPEVGLYASDGHTPLDLWWLPSLSSAEGYARLPTGGSEIRFAQ